MKLFSFFRIGSIAVVLALGAAVGRAEDLGAVKARMEQRVSALDALKDRKVLGENNRGFVEARGALTPSDEQVVSGENADRGQVYAAIAAQTGTTADKVGQRRAQQIANASKPGVWIQTPDGQWVQKQ